MELSVNKEKEISVQQLQPICGRSQDHHEGEVVVDGEHGRVRCGGDGDGQVLDEDGDHEAQYEKDLDNKLKETQHLSCLEFSSLK